MNSGVQPCAAELKLHVGSKTVSVKDGSAIPQAFDPASATDRQTAAALVETLYAELKQLARHRLAQLPAGRTLTPTALVNEVYLRLVRKGDPGWDGRRHFFGAAARAMREILIEQARRKAARKRSDGRRRNDLDANEPQIEPPSDDVLAVHEAMQELEHADPRKGEIVNLRYFSGLTVKETAEALGVSVGTIEREWRFIRAWLAVRLAKDD